jgi:hypothetical protein
VSFFADVADDMVHGMREFQNGATKYAIALGIYELSVFITVGFFKVLNFLSQVLRIIQDVTPLS